MSKTLRVIDFGHVSAVRSQAVYHGLAYNIGAEDDPVLSLVSPDSPYVCVGMFQEVAKEVDEVFCADRQLPVIRRQVGGGAVYLDRNQMFFHFIVPAGKAPGYAANLYPKYIEPVVRTYLELGIAAAYRPVNDIHVNGRKIGGTGAASIGEATVFVGSFMFDFDTEIMSRCLKVPSEKFRDKLRSTLDDYMTTMSKELDELPARELVKKIFLRHVSEVFDIEPVDATLTEEEEVAIAQQERRLADPDWTFRLGRKFVELGIKIAADTHLTESAHKAPGGLIRVHLLEREGRVEDLLLSGDFTCLPPDGIESIAEGLRGAALDQAALQDAAAKILTRDAIELPGVEPADIATAILSAVHS